MSSGSVRTSLIAAMDRHRLIGVNGERMPWHLSEDLRHFKRVTMGKPVIMGRKTFESIGRILPGRLNIVLTRGDSIAAVPGQLVTAPDLDEARRLAVDWLAAQASAPAPPPGSRPTPAAPSAAPAGSKTPELFVIGGADVYAQAIALADRLYLTEIDASFEGNNHFPPFREMQPGWTELHRETHRAEGANNFDYAFVTYERSVVESKAG